MLSAQGSVERRSQGRESCHSTSFLSRSARVLGDMRGVEARTSWISVAMRQNFMLEIRGRMLVCWVVMVWDVAVSDTYVYVMGKRSEEEEGGLTGSQLASGG